MKPLHQCVTQFLPSCTILNNMNRLVRFLGVVTVVAVVTTSLALGGKVSLKEQMSVYEGLRNTAGIVFAVMGAWIALLYPKFLVQLFGKEAGAKQSQESRQITKLFRPLLYSTLVLLVVTIVSFAAPLARQICYLHDNAELLRSLSYGTLALLTSLQFWAVILTLVPADTVKETLEQEAIRNKVVDRMKPGK